MTTTSYDVRSVANALVEAFESYARDADGRIRVEDLLSAGAAACGEACVAAAGQVDPENHRFTPGSVVMSDRANEILANDASDWSAAGESVFGLIRTGALASGYSEADFPPLVDVFRGFATGIAGANAPDWGFVPLSVPTDNRPRVQPVRAAYELRKPLRRLLAKDKVPTAEWPMICALTLVSLLALVRDAIDRGVAVRLVLETVNGMAKTAPMTDKAFRAATS